MFDRKENVLLMFLQYLLVQFELIILERLEEEVAVVHDVFHLVLVIDYRQDFHLNQMDFSIKNKISNC
jgi:hypothetical protein